MLKKLFTPFQDVSSSLSKSFTVGWVLVLMFVWTISAMIGTTHMFPTPLQVIKGFVDLWQNGLMVQMMSSLSLCFQAIFYSVIISMIFAYSTSVEFCRSWGVFISKFRFVPPTGIAFYITIFVTDARNIQIWVLVTFISTFLVTSLIQMISDIPKEEFDHAKTLGCNRWEVLWEVVIKGRLDYVIELVRQNFAIAWVMIVTVESIMVATGGLGVLIKIGDRAGSGGTVVAVQLLIILIGIVIDYILTKIRRIAFRYSNY